MKNVFTNNEREAAYKKLTQMSEEEFNDVMSSDGYIDDVIESMCRHKETIAFDDPGDYNADYFIVEEYI